MQLKKEIKKIKEIDLNWDYPSIEKLIEKYKNTAHTEIKEELYDVVNNWFMLLSYDYECEKVIQNKQAYIEDNLLFSLNLLIKLKSNSRLEWERCYWLKEIASLVMGKTEKEKWLQNAYTTIEKTMKVYGMDFELMSLKISLLLQWEDIQQSAERRRELDALITSILDSLETYPFMDIVEFFIATFWMSKRGNTELCRSYFQNFLDRAEQLLSNQPDLHMDLVTMLAYSHYEENENALQNLQLINTNSHLILENQIAINEKCSKLAKELDLLSNRLSDRPWKRKISLLAEEFIKLLNQAFPNTPEYISGQITLYDEMIMDELDYSKKTEVSNNHFKGMLKLINQSLSINKKYEASSYAGKLKKYNNLLYHNGKPELNKQAIELYLEAIEQLRTISLSFGTEVYSFSSDDRNNLAECYLLQGNLDKAWEVIQEHAAMLEKQKKQYENYAQFDIMRLLEKKEFEPIHEKIKTLSKLNS